jgi:hypothetical protein
MTMNLCCIVEGRGEIQAVPVLLRRIQQATRPDTELNVLRPIRIPRHKIVKPNELERAIELAARQMKPPRAILILIDADDDLPCVLGPELLRIAKQKRSDVPIGVVLANREFESWFLAAIGSLAGRRGLQQNLPPINHVESIRDAKGELKHLMHGEGAYSPVIDQPALAAIFDMAMARRNSDSFDKCWREMERLLNNPFELENRFQN